MSTMRTLGLIGGMSWHSTVTYYRRVNEVVARRRGGHASAPVALQSLDFDDVRACQVAGDYEASARLLVEAGRRCVAGGADLVAIATNLMHKNHPQVSAALDVPVVHIADAVARAARAAGVDTIGLLGTRPVMEESFYAERLAEHGIAVVVPSAADRVEVDRVVFEELTRGLLLDDSRARYRAIVDDLASRGAGAVALACTEIGLLLPPGSGDGPADGSALGLIDTAVAHADLLAELVLAPGDVTVERALADLLAEGPGALTRAAGV
ncbi:amino acid racemase [Nocardioides sp. GY 10127]|uniref:aspartate/glutamate racemase family protein n=1 Tax=Nocardioides sp. GY 10127 TaxID=2569762 RepID=UPI0010A77033|nr:amino acid racemase [Nocardioides sp. GY 10127]TIC82955.1 amino acid racemase [Nocardioides sp. GY 10127]